MMENVVLVNVRKSTINHLGRLVVVEIKVKGDIDLLSTQFCQLIIYKFHVPKLTKRMRDELDRVLSASLYNSM